MGDNYVDKHRYITTKFPEIDNSKIMIATVRADKGDDFKACTSCTSILPKEVNILTGTTPPLPKGSAQPDPSKFIREE